jgi:hypothetical protein
MNKLYWLILPAIFCAGPCLGEERWWMDAPIRLVQTNLRETDSALDVKRLAQQLAEFPANTLLFGMGGIVAHYPTKVAFHYPSPYLPPGRDTFGEMLKEAHARGIRVICRFDFSKAQKPVFDAHPEWFFRKANGEPVIYNGLYSTCINGGYYGEQALKILTEALDRYDIDGLFFNGLGNGTADYSGNPVGLCHCDNCRTRFQARYHRPVPVTPDAGYRSFMASAKQEVVAAISELLHRKRPRAAFINGSEGITSESNTALDRPLPLWPYSASDNVNRARNSELSKMAFNLCIGFVAIPYRFVTVPAAEVQLRQFQNMAHGAGPTFVAVGTLDQEDQSGIIAARAPFQWHAEHEDLYVGQQSAARVLLLHGRQESYRGFFRMLSEQHIPFAVSDNFKWIDDPSRDYQLVISSDGATAELDRYVRRGGRLLAAGAKEPALRLGKVVRKWTETQSAYFRIRDREMFPSLGSTQLLFVNGEYLEMEPAGKPLLTLIPPSMFGPPEKVHINRVETDKPGLLLTDYGKGRVAYIPWDVGGLYYEHSSPGHAGLVTDVIDRLLPAGRQLRTNAHPLVEITVMRQPKRGRTIVHFVNLSGHSSTAYFAPVEMRDIEVELAEDFGHARSAALNQELPVSRDGQYHKFSLPRLGKYDAVVLEK